MTWSDLTSCTVRSWDGGVLLCNECGSDCAAPESIGDGRGTTAGGPGWAAADSGLQEVMSQDN